MNLEKIDDAVLFWAQCKAKVQGWCSDEKAKHIIEMCEQFNVQSALEIGVYGGQSLAAIAIGMMRNAQVRNQQDIRLWAIDPWHNDSAVLGNDPENAAWWANIDLGVIKMEFHRMFESMLEPELKKFKYSEAIISSSTAHFHIRKQIRDNKPFDLFHIDGNHSEVAALGDAALCMDCVVAERSVIILDDVGRFETQKADDYLHSKLIENYGHRVKRHIWNGYSTYYVIPQSYYVIPQSKMPPAGIEFGIDSEPLTVKVDGLHKPNNLTK